MPGVDWIPLVSQVKAGLQLITGDVEGAAQTTKNFYQECPVVSQTLAVGLLIAGKDDLAEETFKKGVSTISNVVDSVPVVGHVKGVIHHAVGDHKGGNRALNSATRTTTVIGAGVVAGVTTGGIAAIPAGIAAGSAYDAVDSVVSDKPKGSFAAIENVVNNPNAGTVFDLAAGYVGDGLAGRAGGSIGNKIAINNLKAARNAKLNVLETGVEKGMTSGEALQLGREMNALTKQIDGRLGVKNVGGKVPQVVAEKPFNPGAILIVEDKLKANPQQKNSHLSQTTTKAIRGKAESHYQTAISALISFILNLSQDPKRPQITQEKRKFLDDRSWLHVQLPNSLPYTGAVMTNNTREGLLHMLIGHQSDFEQVIPGLRRLLNGSSITSAPQWIQMQAQIMVYQFLNQAITSNSYLGLTVNNNFNGQYQLHFNLFNGKTLVICVSTDLFEASGEFENFGDGRPIRTIITAYIENYRNYW